MNWLDRKLYRKPWWRKLRGLPEPKHYTATEVQDALNRAFQSSLDRLKDNVNRDYD